MITGQSTSNSHQFLHPNPDLEQAADDVLDAAGVLGRRRGIYSEPRLTRKIRREDKKEVSINDVRPADEMTTLVVERWLDELMDVGCLTAMEEICFRLYFAGRTPHRIAADLGLPYRKVCRRLRSARRKLRYAYQQGPYAGWQEVYLAEVNRHVYRAPRSRRS